MLINFNAAFLRRIRKIIKQNINKASRKKIILDLIIHGGRSIKKSTIMAIANTVKLSSTLSTRIVPSAEDIFMELFWEIK